MRGRFPGGSFIGISILGVGAVFLEKTHFTEAVSDFPRWAVFRGGGRVLQFS